MTDSYPESFFAGLIAVGDEIIEVDNISTADLSLEQVYDLMARKDLLLIRLLPLLARKDTCR